MWKIQSPQEVGGTENNFFKCTDVQDKEIENKKIKNKLYTAHTPLSNHAATFRSTFGHFKVDRSRYQIGSLKPSSVVHYSIAFVYLVLEPIEYTQDIVLGTDRLD